MSRYFDYPNSISWQNQSLAAGVTAQKESSRSNNQNAGLYQHAPHPAYTSTAQDSRVVLPITPRSNVLYPQSMYHQYQQTKPQAPVLSNYPVLQDVKFKRLPFYDVLGEILKTTSLIPMSPQRPQEATFSFYLSPQQATDIATGRDIVGVSNKLEFIVQVQLRFCLAETTCEQEDYFPPSCVVKINGKMCPLPSPIPTNKPGVEPKRPPRPVNITNLVKLCPTIPNTMSISWGTDFSRNYAFCVTLVRKLTSCQLLTRLKNKGTKHSDYTRSLIKEKLREDLDSEIATTSLRVSLVCPLGKMRMVCPCRPATCSHLQCFDASLFLQMNERKPTWLCPVCDKPALYDTLVVDGYFQDVLNSPKLGADCCEVQLHNDGAWSPHIIKKDGEPFAPPVKDTTKKIEVISDDLEVIPLSDGSNSSARATPKPSTMSPANDSMVASSETPRTGGDVVDLTSDSEEEVPVKRKVAKPADSTLSNNHQDAAPINYNNDASINNSTGVSSSGYQSPAPISQSPVASGAIISLDSPSPPPAPVSPLPAHQASVPRPRVTCNSQLLPQARY